MGVKWVTFLNDGAATGQNDYLVTKLVGAGIEPVMRLWTAKLEPMQGDVEGMVRHYVGLGMHYFQPYNEPNLNDEQPDGVASVDRYLNTWIPVAQAIVRGGGLPGLRLDGAGRRQERHRVPQRSHGRLEVARCSWARSTRPGCRCTTTPTTIPSNSAPTRTASSSSARTTRS